jgi:hypothetical protein
MARDQIYKEYDSELDEAQEVRESERSYGSTRDQIDWEYGYDDEQEINEL